MLANFGYLDTELQTPDRGQQRQAADADAGRSRAACGRPTACPVGSTVGGGVRHTDAVYINAANTIHAPGYHLVDALAEYAVNTHLSLRLNVYNLTDEVYIRNVNNNGGRYNPGQPAGSGAMHATVTSSQMQVSMQDHRSLDTRHGRVHGPRGTECCCTFQTSWRPCSTRASGSTSADWVDGRVTAGQQSARVKDNLQLPEDHPAARELGDLILAALQRHPLFIVGGAAAAGVPAAVQPLRGRAGVRQPRRQRGAAGARHAACAFAPTSRRRCFSPIRTTTTAASCVVEDTYGVHSVKLPAGHLVLYPSTSLHHVRPVTRGARIASFFWIQSMVRDDGRAHAAVRSRHRDPARERRPAGSSGRRAAHGRLPQPAAPLGGSVAAFFQEPRYESISHRLCSGCTWPPASPRASSSW